VIVVALANWWFLSSDAEFSSTKLLVAQMDGMGGSLSSYILLPGLVFFSLLTTERRLILCLTPVGVSEEKEHIVWKVVVAIRGEGKRRVNV